jgi:hypothetical protein
MTWPYSSSWPQEGDFLMRATDLFSNAPDWQPEDDELGALEEFLEGSAAKIVGLRIVEIEDHDASGDACDAMESGVIQNIDASSFGNGGSAASKLEALFVTPVEDYGVRIALIDPSSTQANEAINRALLSDVDLIVVSPWSKANETSQKEFFNSLSEAARTGHAVFAIHAALS